MYTELQNAVTLILPQKHKHGNRCIFSGNVLDTISQQRPMNVVARVFELILELDRAIK